MVDWQTVTDEVSDNTWDREGTIQGVYIRKKTDVGPNDSNMYELKKDGNITSVWGSTILDSRFEQIPIGSEVRITGLGKAKSEKTGREYFDYKVEFRPAPFVEAGEADKPIASESLKPEPSSSDDGPPIESRESQGDEEAPF